MADANKQLNLTLIKSPAGRKQNHRACVRGLGLRRMHQTVTVVDTPANRGMVNKIMDMLVIEEA